MSNSIQRTAVEIEKLRETADKLVDREGSVADADADLIREMCDWFEGKISFAQLISSQDLPA